ncbi:hypothetical protein C2845_PM03G34930 [Panicum miliaceum]|uniref:Uncharacterized protein n=1 Tax=Panicum miliaceum TaxID=4540 RepID=A0A3L6T615_PANMI|nr:hypothetical protein C2845_PM03G34930 [Panicum miliaceum]
MAPRNVLPPVNMLVRAFCGVLRQVRRRSILGLHCRGPSARRNVHGHRVQNAGALHLRRGLRLPNADNRHAMPGVGGPRRGGRRHLAMRIGGLVLSPTTAATGTRCRLHRAATRPDRATGCRPRHHHHFARTRSRCRLHRAKPWSHPCDASSWRHVLCIARRRDRGAPSTALRHTGHGATSATPGGGTGAARTVPRRRPGTTSDATSRIGASPAPDALLLPFPVADARVLILNSGAPPYQSHPGTPSRGCSIPDPGSTGLRQRRLHPWRRQGLHHGGPARRNYLLQLRHGGR